MASNSPKVLIPVRQDAAQALRAAKTAIDNGLSVLFCACGAQPQVAQNLSGVGEVVVVPWTGSYSAARNRAEKSVVGPIFWLNPWEKIEKWGDCGGEEVAAVTAVYGDVIVRTARLWTAGKNPWDGDVFERPTVQPNEIADVVISGTGGWFDERFLLSEWERREPHNPQVSYYRAMERRATGDHSGFLEAASRFLFSSEIATDAVVICRYYVAQTEIRSFSRFETGLGHLAAAIAERPWMAEFWCLAAEAFRRMGQFGRAAAMYDNAMQFGQRRPSLDGLPIEMSKYGEEPEKFLNDLKLHAESR